MILNAIMKANATTCLIFGGLFLLLPTEVITFLSIDKPMPILVLKIIAIGLIVNGFHLLQTSYKKNISKLWVFYFSGGDFSWVLLSSSLLLLDVWVTSKAGIISMMAVASIVALFGYLQLVSIKKRGV